MLNKHLRIIIAVCLATFCVITGSAQAAIQKIVDQLEKEKDISVTYSERRNPSTKKSCLRAHIFRAETAPMPINYGRLLKKNVKTRSLSQKNVTRRL